VGLACSVLTYHFGVLTVNFKSLILTVLAISRLVVAPENDVLSAGVQNLLQLPDERRNLG
jgi:hypothetical protein